MERKIDMGSWSRREIYSFFSGVSNPFYAVTFRQDVTKLHEYAKRNGLSFYYSLIWLCTQAINETDAFRYTIRGGEVYRLDGRAPSFTDMKKGGDCFLHRYDAVRRHACGIQRGGEGAQRGAGRRGGFCAAYRVGQVCPQRRTAGTGGYPLK